MPRIRRGFTSAIACAAALVFASACGKKDPTPTVTPPEPVEPHFASATVTANLTMAYAQEVAIEIVGGDTERWVFVEAAPLDEGDIYFGFIGPLSADEPVLLAAGERRTAILAVSSQDAERTSYSLDLILKTFDGPDGDLEQGTEVGRAKAALTITAPVVNLRFEMVSQDAATLAQHWRITNDGDEVSDLAIEPLGLFATQVQFDPEPDHIALPKNATTEFTMAPEIYPGMKELAGELLVTAGRSEFKRAVTFTVPNGKEVFIGFGASVKEWRYGGTHCTNEGKLNGTFGRLPRRAPQDATPDDFWSKKGMANLYRKGIKDGMTAAKALKSPLGQLPGKGKHLDVPMIAAQFVFGGIAGNIENDPPDPNYGEVARPALRTPPTYTADDDGLTTDGAEALNALVANVFLIADLGRAISATLDKLGGAREANDAAWMQRQEIVFRSYASMITSRLHAHAGLLERYFEVGPEYLNTSLDVENVQAMQADLLANGFSTEELANFRLLGMTDTEIEAMKQEILSANPENAVAFEWSEFPAKHWTDAEDAPGDLARVFELAAMSVSATTVTNAALLVRFELDWGRNPIDPHDTVVRLNGVELGRIAQKVPEGLYAYPVARENIKFFAAQPSGNEWEFETLDMNNGAFVRTLDISLVVDMSVHGDLVLATSQAEADAISGAMEQYNHATPDLALAANQFPNLVRSAIGDEDTVQLPLTIRNLGPVASPAAMVKAYSADPREGEQTSLITPLSVPAIAAWGEQSVTLALKGKLLKGGGAEGEGYSLWISVEGGEDFDPANNTIKLTPE